MPERMPRYEYKLCSFEAHDTESIIAKMINRNIDYRDIVNIVWCGNHYRVFYGLKIMR